MRTRAAFARPLFAVLLVALTPLFASADAWTLPPGQWSSELRGSRFSSDDFHDLSGTRTTLAGGGLVEGRSATWSSEIGWKKNTSFAFTVPFDALTRRLGDGSSATETGFGDLLLGLRHHLLGGANWVLSAQVDLKAPGGYSRLVGLAPSEIAALDSTVLDGLSPGDSANVVRQLARPRLGNGETAYQAMVIYGRSMPRLRSFIELGFGYREHPQHLANQLLASGDVGVWFGPSLLVTGRYRGELAFPDARDLRPRIAEAAAKGKVLKIENADTPADAVDQQMVGAEIRYRVDDNIDTFIGSWHSAGATNALHMDQFYAGITFKSTKLGRYQGVLGGKK